MALSRARATERKAPRPGANPVSQPLPVDPLGANTVSDIAAANPKASITRRDEWTPERPQPVIGRHIVHLGPARSISQCHGTRPQHSFAPRESGRRPTTG